MGGFSSVTSALGLAGNALGATKALRGGYSDYSKVAAASKLAQTTYDNTERDIAAQAALQSQKDDADSADAARTRAQAFRKALATRQAAFGGQGIDTSDGSGEAVMLGLFANNDEDRKASDRLDGLKRQSLAQSTDAKRRRNLLALERDYSAAQDSTLRSLNQFADDLT